MIFFQFDKFLVIIKMSIIKTKKFDQKLNNDISWITINKYQPLQISGSYKVKEWGDIITDIDYKARVYFTPKLLDIISNIIHKNKSKKSPFTILHMTAGKYDGYEVPWTIDETGGCDFDPTRAKEWFKLFKTKNLVTSNDLKYIEAKLFSDNMKIQNLIDIGYVLWKHYLIIWNLDDIHRGFVERKGKRYYLLEQMKTKIPVLRIIYHYQENKYVSIDLSLIDKKYKIPITMEMYRYYTNDWYKIMKSFRWKLPKEERVEYFKVMNSITKMIAIKYQLDFIELLKKYKGLTPIETDRLLVDLYEQIDSCYVLGNDYRNLGLTVISTMLYEQVNKTLRDYVLFYANKLPSQHKNRILLYLKRGIESQIPVTYKEIKKRSAVGIKCPFFPTDMNEFEELIQLAIKLDMKTDLVVNCFSQVAVKLGKSVPSVIKDVIKTNNLSLFVGDKDIILRDNGKEIGKYPVEYKKKLQAYILLKS